MNVPNAKRLKRILKHIVTHRDRWRQTGWVTHLCDSTTHKCKTAYCFGGWAQVFAGYRSDSNNVEMHARAYLNLNRAQATLLFRGDNTLSDLKQIVRGLCRKTPLYHEYNYTNPGYDYDRLDCNNLPRSGRRTAKRKVSHA